jgi:putative FmdB family regulatory protein
MPTYEYKCDACGYGFERFQSIKADPIKRCPECGKAKVKRMIGTGAGMIFKGSGFYITDYRSESYNNAAKAEQGGGGSSTGGEGKTETKAGAKSESKPTETKPETKPVAPAAKTETKVPKTPKKS